MLSITNQKKRVAVITARGGSKRIKNKNLIHFFGKPLISYSIIAAKKTNIFDNIYVTTDSRKIKKISEKYGAIVPYLREKKLSDDFTGTHEVIENFIKKLNLFDCDICCIYPTAPLVRSKDIISSYSMMPKKNYIFSANKTLSNKGKVFLIDHENRITKLYQTMSNKNNFIDAGQFYWASAKTWIKKKKIISLGTKIKKIPKKFAHDLNTYDDLLILKKKYKEIKK